MVGIGQSQRPIINPTSGFWLSGIPDLVKSLRRYPHQRGGHFDYSGREELMIVCAGAWRLVSCVLSLVNRNARVMAPVRHYSHPRRRKTRCPVSGVAAIDFPHSHRRIGSSDRQTHFADDNGRECKFFPDSLVQGERMYLARRR